MSADWSAIRRRQTLGEVLNNVPGASQIPQPSSVFKKSGAGRASVAPGGLTGLGPAPPRSSLAPARFVRSSSGGNLVSDIGVMQMTTSLGSSGSGSQRESLRNSRQSYAPQQSVKYVPLIPPSSLCPTASVVLVIWTGLIVVADGVVLIQMADLQVSASYPKSPPQ